MVKDFLGTLLQKICFWGVLKAYFETHAENKALKQQLERQQHDLEVASLPCYQWQHLIDRL